ncbi:MAG: zf-HC2 domain-containing protein [Acidobacteriota bacterium]|nr:zf-HC2 domain-containing protein [Acidobacteriota bacterium]MDH3525379.1 zf-HC2 domain-containing protein [Acidobacteriota bacterium]
MNEYRKTPFDESLFSGYLDGELTQAEEQKVRLHLEDDPEARALVAELRAIRQAARSTRLAAPADEEWREAPRSGASRFLRRSGWLLAIGWAVAVLGFALWGAATSPESWWERALVAGAVGGPLLLFSSVLLDRLKVMKTDRYGRVRR